LGRRAKGSFYECLNRQAPECPEGAAPHRGTLGRRLLEQHDHEWFYRHQAGPGPRSCPAYNSEVTGIVSNKIYRALPEGYSIFEKVEAFYGAENIRTIFLGGKFGNTGGACSETDDAASQPYCKTKQKIDFFENGLFLEPMVGEKALSLIEQYRDERLLALIHFAQPDDIGHVCGENCPLYSASLVVLDEWLGKIMDKLRALGIYEKTLLYVVSDHGFDEGKWNHRMRPLRLLPRTTRRSCEAETEKISLRLF
jgi:hypothetical protein